MEPSIIAALIGALAAIAQSIIGPIVNWSLQVSELKKDHPDSDAYKKRRKWLKFHVSVVIIGIVVFIVSSVLAYIGGTEMKNIASSFSPIWKEELASNGEIEVSLDDMKTDISVDTLPWYDAKQERIGLENLTVMKLPEPLIELPKLKQYLLFDSELYPKKDGYTAVVLKRKSMIILPSIDLSLQGELILVIFAQKPDVIEIKLKDTDKVEPKLLLPVKSGWAVYRISLREFGNEIDLRNITQVQIAHPKHHEKRLERVENKFKLAWLHSR